MRRMAPSFGVSSATACRVIRRLGPHLALAPVRARAADVERLWIVDGTLIPVRDRSVAASSRNHRLSTNAQVVVDAGTPGGGDRAAGAGEPAVRHDRAGAEVRAVGEHRRARAHCRLGKDGLHHAVQAVAHLHIRRRRRPPLVGVGVWAVLGAVTIAVVVADRN